MILIIAGRRDAHARIVARRLREKGAAVELFDLAEMPARAASVVRVEKDGVSAVIRREAGVTIDLAQARAIWFRRVSAPAGSESLAEEDRAFARDESISLLVGLGASLADRFWVNAPAAALANDAGRGKIHQLEVARRVGVSVPRTLATNDPDEARAFIASCASGAIFKPFRTPVREREEDGRARVYAVYTNKLSEAALAKLDGVRHAPCIFQDYVAKRFELRAVVMGERVFACEIHSQAREKGAIDFRRDTDVAATPHVPHEMPRAIAEKLVRLNRELGLVFGVLDLIVTPEGEYVFLENNQQGQFLWLEELAGLPLLENFCEMLMQRRADFACDAYVHAPAPFPDAPEER